MPVCRVSCFLPRGGRAAGQDGRDGGVATAERNGRGVGERTAASGRQVKCAAGGGRDGGRIGGEGWLSRILRDSGLTGKSGFGTIYSNIGKKSLSTEDLSNAVFLSGGEKAARIGLYD